MCIAEADVVPEGEYHLRRMIMGIPEGPEELHPGAALPLESCMDIQGGGWSILSRSCGRIIRSPGSNLRVKAIRYGDDADGQSTFEKDVTWVKN